MRPASTLPTPAVVEQHTEQDEHQQGQRAQDGEQEQGVVGGDVPQTGMRQTQSCKTNQEDVQKSLGILYTLGSCTFNISVHKISDTLRPLL